MGSDFFMNPPRMTKAEIRAAKKRAPKRNGYDYVLAIDAAIYADHLSETRIRTILRKLVREAVRVARVHDLGTPQSEPSHIAEKLIP